jgi:hypothetical protein
MYYEVFCQAAFHPNHRKKDAWLPATWGLLHALKDFTKAD